AKGEGEFLDGGGACFADVVAADGDDIEFGCVLHAELEGVDHQAHGGFGRVDVFLLRDVFLEDVVLQRAGDFLPVGALLFGDGEVHGPNDGGGGVDGHAGGDIGERDLIEEDFHIGEGGDGDAAFADFAFGEGGIGIVAHERGEIESGGEDGLAVGEEIAEALVGVLGGAETGELAHGPKAGAVHGGVNAAGVGGFAREAEIA